MIGVIPAAGRGTRAYPYTKGIPKCMLEVAGEPNLARVIRIMRDQLGIVEIVVVVGEFGDVVRERFGDGSQMRVKLRYVHNDAIDKGLSHSILLSKPYVDDYFCVILGDECYLDSDHRALLASDYRRHLATCGVLADAKREDVAKNYAVYVDDGRVERLVEKPVPDDRALLGLGTFLFSPEIYDHLARATAGDSGEPDDPVSVLGRLCAAGRSIAAVDLRCQYVNINDRDALNLACNLIRTRDFSSCTLSLALLAKGPDETTLRILDEFRDTGRFAQIVVVVPAGASLAVPESPDVRVCPCPTGRYGDMMLVGLDAARAEILVTAQSDGSCAPRDLPKFLEYLKDADMVIGTRTTRQLIHQGTNMRGIVRIAHVLLAKLLEAGWWSYEPRFTDVGCAYRALWSSTYRLVRPKLVRRGPAHSAEILVEILRCRKRIIEIPVSYPLPKRGVREKDQTIGTFFALLWVIVARRLAHFAGR